MAVAYNGSDTPLTHAPAAGPGVEIASDERGSGPSGPRAVSVALAAAIPALLAVLVYLNALHNPFVYDDYRTVVNNGSIVSLRDWRSVVLHDATRPVVNTSLAIDRRVWGPDPFGFHLTSVLLHAVNVLLVFVLLRAAMRDHMRARGVRHVGAARRSDPLVLVAAFAAAALLAVHPMMTEAVGYISERSEVLCTTFFLTAFLLARRWMTGGGAVWWIAATLVWLIAIATKETAAMLPVLVLLYDRLILAGDPAAHRRRLLRLQLPWLTAAGLAAAARGVVFLHPSSIPPDSPSTGARSSTSSTSSAATCGCSSSRTDSRSFTTCSRFPACGRGRS